MTLEERYRSSKLNSKPKAYSGQSQQTKDNSALNVDAKVPTKYNTEGKIAKIKDSSGLNVDGNPKKYKP